MRKLALTFLLVLAAACTSITPARKPVSADAVLEWKKLRNVDGGETSSAVARLSGPTAKGFARSGRPAIASMPPDASADRHLLVSHDRGV